MEAISDDRARLADQTKGWLFPDEGPFLRSLALRCSGPYLEVGSYCGKSTIWIGDSAEANGTVLFAVDHHQGSPEMAPDRDCHDPEMVDGDGAHDTLLAFRRTIRAACLTNTIIPVVAATATIGPLWALPVGFVFIDAAHDYAGCKLDSNTWLSRLTIGGLAAFHDTTIPAIAQVVDEAAASSRFDEIEGCHTIRVLQRVQ